MLQLFWVALTIRLTSDINKGCQWFWYFCISLKLKCHLETCILWHGLKGGFNLEILQKHPLPLVSSNLSRLSAKSWLSHGENWSTSTSVTVSLHLYLFTTSEPGLTTSTWWNKESLCQWWKYLYYQSLDNRHEDTVYLISILHRHFGYLVLAFNIINCTEWQILQWSWFLKRNCMDGEHHPKSCL